MGLIGWMLAQGVVGALALIDPLRFSSVMMGLYLSMARPPGVNDDGAEEHDAEVEDDAENKSSMFEVIMAVEV